uniref:GtrA family protein n=1 Tax=Thermosphaera aggregans TaxID=54254 RepID=A0A7C2FD34_9CREN
MSYVSCAESDIWRISVRRGFEALCVKLKDTSYPAGVECVEVRAPLPFRIKLAVLLGSLMRLEKPQLKKPVGIIINKKDEIDLEEHSCETLKVSLNPQEADEIIRSLLPLSIALPLIEPLRVVKFLIVGVAGSIVNLAIAQSVFNYLTGIGVVDLIKNPISSLTGFESSVLFNFTLHEKWTFADTNIDRGFRNVITRLIKYHGASITSFTSQILLATFLPILLGVVFWLAQLTGIIVGFALNFILGYVYTWSRSRV